MIKNEILLFVYVDAEAYLEPSQVSKMDNFAKIVNY